MKIGPSKEMDKLNIIFVDDEVNLLNGLKRFLRKKSKEWDMRFYESAREALKATDEFVPDVVVSDMRMPEMNGVEFLEEVRKKHPSSIRFILSGFSDRTLIIKSVGVTHQFFTKPIEGERVVEAIEFSNSLYRRIGNPEIQKIITGVDTLPTPSQTYEKIEAELSKEEPNLEILSDIVMGDVSVSVKVLQLVNSAFFGVSSSVSDIVQATMLLGVDVLKYLSLSLV